MIAATFLAPLPYASPDRLVEFWQTSGPGTSRPQDYLQPVRMEERVRKRDFRTLQAVAATGMGPTLVMHAPGGAVKVLAAPVLGDWFGTLAVGAARGRVLTDEDLRPGAAPGVVSDAFRRASSTSCRWGGASTTVRDVAER